MDVCDSQSPQAERQSLDVSLVLTHDLHAPGEARAMVAENTKDLDVAERDDLLVLVSEVVTNAVTHGRPDVVLHLVVTKGLVRVEVHDRGDAFERDGAQPVAINRSSGRGLVIVDSLATSWGTDSAPDTRGKRVWFELSVAGTS